MANLREKPLLGYRILVVEDTVQTALRTLAWIERMGAEADVRASVAQAKRRLSEAAFDLVVIDYQLIGNATGTDLALWMRDQPDLQQILRVSYSGSEPHQILEGVPEDTYHKVIPKTTRARDLIQQLC